MKKSNEPTKGPESIGDAARRLLAGLERAKKKVAGNQSPERIANLGLEAPAEIEASEVAAGSRATLAGRWGLPANNDNFAGGAFGILSQRYVTAQPVNGYASPARLNSDDSVTPKIARMVTLRGFGECDY